MTWPLREILTILCLVLFYCTKPQVELAPIAIIPQPQKVLPDSGYFTITAETVIAVENQQQQAVASHFANMFLESSGWAPEVKVTPQSAQIALHHLDELPDEGYLLKVDTKGVQISASTSAGFFYAFQTLMQLLPPSFVSSESRDRWAIPAVKIEDAPAFGWRGFMLDVSRHFFDKEQIKKILDLMSEIKMNRFHWHLTDDQGWRVEIKSYPKLTEIGSWRVDYTNYDETISDWWGRPEQQQGEKAAYGGFYSQQDIHEIVTYAKERYIEIIPEIDMPGHAQATIAAYPEIGCINAAPYVATGGVFKNNTYNPGKEETFLFAEKMLNEIMDLFPYEYIHIGGDECNKEQWKLDPHARRRMKEEGLNTEEDLQSYFIKRIEGIINRRGKKLIGWDEILEGGLAPNATVMSWRGEAGGIAAAQAGHDVIMTPNKYCYIDLKQGPDDLEPNLGYSRMLLKDAYAYKLIPEGFSEDQARHVLGTQANLWTESITDWGKLTYMTYPRIYAIAENGWTDESIQKWDHFVNRLEPHLRRLDLQNIRYATSAFNVNIIHRGIEKGIEITLSTEVNGLDYYYTLDGSEPDTSSFKYTGPFTANEGLRISARAFIDNQPVGQTSSLSFPIHLGTKGSIRYHTPYLDFKDAAGEDALVDYNYASLTISDDNWQGFGGDMEVDIIFPVPQKVSEVQLTNLRFTISGVYVPESHQVFGSADGKEYFLLGEIEQKVKSHTQGRNKVTTKISFDPQEVKSLKIKSNSLNPIPQGHHRAGEASKIYLDEIVIF